MTSRRDGEGIDRRGFLGVGALGGAATLAGACAPSGSPPPGDSSRGYDIPAFEFDEATVAQLQERMASGELTSRQLTQAYLDRIEALDRQGPTLRSVIETNPEALSIAAALDAERMAEGVRGPLHGIPVLLKDNIDTADRLTTTAGSLALEGSIPEQDSGVARRLRAAGAVILGKANLSEWANFRSEHSTSGWSGRGGGCRNPYALDRNPCGSSSGSGVAVSANLTALAIGTETNGSIVCPSNARQFATAGCEIGMEPRWHQRDPLLGRPSPELRMELCKRAQAHPRAPERRPGRHVPIVEELHTFDLVQILEQKDETRAAPSGRVDARHSNGDTRGDLLAEYRLDFPEPDHVCERARGELGAGQLDVGSARGSLLGFPRRLVLELDEKVRTVAALESNPGKPRRSHARERGSIPRSELLDQGVDDVRIRDLFGGARQRTTGAFLDPIDQDRAQGAGHLRAQQEVPRQFHCRPSSPQDREATIVPSPCRPPPTS